MNMNNPLFSPEGTPSPQPPTRSDVGGPVNASPGQTPVAGKIDSAPSPSFPPGHRLVADSDWSQRESAYKRWSELGLSDDEAGNYAQLIKAVKGRKEDPLHLASFLAGGKKESKEEQPSFDPERFKAETLSEWRREQAVKEYDSKWTDLREKGVKAKIAEILGGKDDEVLSPLLYKAAMHDLTEARFASARPENDPLFGLRGLDINEKMLSDILNPYGELAKKLRGQKLAAVAEAATKGRNGTPGGNTGGNAGGPKADGDIPPSRERIHEAVAAKLAKLRS